MTFDELLIACGEQKDLPEVEVTAITREPGRNKFKVGDKGKVVAIKKGDGHYGVGVQFAEVSYVIWFYAENTNDNRMNYMENLKIV